MHAPPRPPIAAPAHPLPRVVVALAISLALHAALVLGVRGEAPGAATGSGTLDVWLVAESPLPRPAPAQANPVIHESARAETPPDSAPTAPPRPVHAGEATPPAEAVETAPRPDRGMPLAFDPTYYPVRALDVPPVPRAPIEPVYPRGAEAERQTGLIRMVLRIEADGRVSAAEVIQAEPAGVFEDSARAAFLAARFSPGQRGGRPVRSQLLIEVRYDLDAPAPDDAP